MVNIFGEVNEPDESKPQRGNFFFFFFRSPESCGSVAKDRSRTRAVYLSYLEYIVCSFFLSRAFLLFFHALYSTYSMYSRYLDPPSQENEARTYSSERCDGIRRVPQHRS